MVRKAVALPPGTPTVTTSPKQSKDDFRPIYFFRALFLLRHEHPLHICDQPHMPLNYMIRENSVIRISMKISRSWETWPASKFYNTTFPLSQYSPIQAPLFHIFLSSSWWNLRLWPPKWPVVQRALKRSPANYPKVNQTFSRARTHWKSSTPLLS